VPIKWSDILIIRLISTETIMPQEEYYDTYSIEYEGLAKEREGFEGYRNSGHSSCDDGSCGSCCSSRRRKGSNGSSSSSSSSRRRRPNSLPTNHPHLPLPGGGLDHWVDR